MESICKRFCAWVRGEDPSPLLAELRPWRDQTEYIQKIEKNEQNGVYKSFLKFLACARKFDITYGLLYRKRSKHSIERRRYNERIVIYRLSFFVTTLVITQFFNHWAVGVVNGYVAAMLVVFLLGVVFLRNYYNRPYSTDRSLMFVLIHYIEITIAFAILHRVWTTFDSCKAPNVFEILYFSFVTSATVGYGDLSPQNWIGKLLVIIQIVVMLLFVVVFLNHFATSAKVADNGE